MSYTYLGIPKIVMFPFLTGVSSRGGGGGGGGSDGSLATAAPFAATSKNGSRCQLDLNFNVFLTVLKTSVVIPDLKFPGSRSGTICSGSGKNVRAEKTDSYFLYLLLLFRKVLWIVLLHVITVTVD